MRVWSRLLQEAIIAFLMGSVPVLIAYHYGGDNAVAELFKTAMPTRPILVYWALLSIPYAFIVVIDHFVFKRSDTARVAVRFLRITFKEIGPAFLSLWRVMAGYLLMLPVLWFVVERETFEFAEVASSILIGGALLLEAVVMSVAISFFDEKWNRRSSTLLGA